MRNIVKEKPTDSLHGRTLYNTEFVDDSDIKNKTVLDVGCGFGWFELNALQREAAHITGTEISKEDLETARRYIENDKIDFNVGNAINLPFKDQSFDTVVSWEVIEHIPKNTEDKMFKEVNRVLKFAGVFYMSTPHKSFFSNIFDPAWWLIGHRHYSRNQLVSLAKNNGFRAEKAVVNGGWWEIIGINNLYIAKWIFRRRAFFEKFINKMQDVVGNNAKWPKKDNDYVPLFLIVFNSSFDK